MNDIARQFRSKGSAIFFVALFGLSLALPTAAAERIPNDPYLKQQSYLRQIGAPEAWNFSLGFEGITVAIIDSGVDIDHPDLKRNIWVNTDEIPNNGIDDDRNGYVDDYNGWDFVGNDKDPRPEYGPDFDQLGVSHGTINAGIVAASGDNGEGIVGVTWQTSIMPLRVLDSEGEGRPIDVVRAVEYAVNNGAKVINLSFAGPAREDLLAIALRRAYDAGVFVVAAAGNADGNGGQPVDLDRQPLYPICLDQDADENFVYGVAAVDASDKRASFSNFGAGCVDLSAPGERFISTIPYWPKRPGYESAYGGYFNGTSVAAPVVAGAVALMIAVNRQLTPKQIMNYLTESSFPIDALNAEYFGKLGRGRLDIAKALSKLLSKKATIAPAPVTTASLLPANGSGPLIVTAPGPGRRAEIRLFTSEGIFVRGWDAFPDGFRGGVTLAAGQFSDSGRLSIVAGAGSGGAPQVRIFNANSQIIGQFFAFDQKFRGGVSVATGDFDGDGMDEISVGAGPGGGPHIRIFEADGTPIGGFFAFDQKFRGGVTVAAADLNGDKIAEIVAVSGSGMTTTVRVFDRRGQQLFEFQPFGKSYRLGGRPTLGDIDGDGLVEILVRGLTGKKQTAFTANGQSETLPSGFIYETSVVLPVSGRLQSVACADGEAMVPTVAVRHGNASRLSFVAYEAKFRGGVRVAVIE